MRRPCVRVDREDGERTRQSLEEAGVRDHEAAIESDGEYVYIPVIDGAAILEEFEVIERELEPRTARTLPNDLLSFTPTYERLGDLVLLQEDDRNRAIKAASAFMRSDLPVEAVLWRRSEVEGTYRIADWELLEGDRTETVHREYGAEFLVDPTKAYFSPRLATERHRVVSQIQQGEQVVDMFAGVGPFAIRAALAGAKVIAVDVNPDAVTYLTENVRRNGVENAVTVIEGDVGEIVDNHTDWADRIIMNLPHRADEYLGTAGLFAAASCRLHYYDIQPEVDAFNPGIGAINEVLAGTYEIEVITEQAVRSYAPGVINICLDVHLQRRTEKPPTP